MPVSAWVLSALTLLAIAAAVMLGGAGSAKPELVLHEPTVRVRIARAMPDLRFDGEGGGAVSLAGDSLGGSIAAGAGRLFVKGDTLMIDAGGSPVELGRSVTLFPAAPGGRIRLGDRVYAGPLSVRASPDDPGALEAVAELPMESYLPGVLAGELYAGWPGETYRAQAVAARSYALHERARARAANRWFDLESTTADQMFIGDDVTPEAAEAVRATRGVILRSGGGVLRAYYSSTCGGRPASAAVVWPSKGSMAFNAAGPLQSTDRGCACADSPLFTWTRERGRRELHARLTAWGDEARHPIRKLKGIAAIEPAEINSAGRPDVYLVTGTGGREALLTAEELRVAANTPARGYPTVGRSGGLPSGDLEAEVLRTKVIFRGRGFGHGVGMCQWGAAGMADRGATWADILSHAYPGAELVRGW